jgi:hypothetical protein
MLMAMRAEKPCPSNRRGCQGNLEDFFAQFIGHRNEIAFADHAGPFGSNPMCDKTPMILGFGFVRAVMAEQVVSGKPAG